MTEAMFCNQCEQTSKGEGCVKVGVCGKDPKVASLQDLLVHQMKGIGFLGSQMLKENKEIEDETHKQVMDALFATLTNVNFDEDRFFDYLRQAQALKDKLKKEAEPIRNGVPKEVEYRLPETKEEIYEDARKAGLRSEQGVDPDIQSLRESLLFSLKGMAAYAHHAYVLGYKDEDVNNFFYEGFAALTDETLNVGALLDRLMEFGRVNLRCMELLDEANTKTYGDPEPTEVLTTKKKGPFIVVSGHDLKDLKELLEQTKGEGVNVYTHGEMLPAHSYPELKKYQHLIGNFGSAWQNQRREFENLPGCILMTTNCLQKPKDTYKDRIFTTGVVGWNKIKHILEKGGRKDFSDVIAKAKELKGWQEDEKEEHITVGFGHKAVLDNAEKIVEAVKGGQIRHFFLVGGCDGAKSDRSYYTDFAKKTPQDTIILTLACGKYRFYKEDFGTVAGFPRLLDMGQCNDTYSAIKVASALAEAFECDVNDLPLTLVVSWYEQKAVAILMSLLALGIKNIYLGPTLPAFITPNVLDILVDKFELQPISSPEEDLKAALG